MTKVQLATLYDRILEDENKDTPLLKFLRPQKPNTTGWQVETRCVQVVGRWIIHSLVLELLLHPQNVPPSRRLPQRCRLPPSASPMVSRVRVSHRRRRKRRRPRQHSRRRGRQPMTVLPSRKRRSSEGLWRKPDCPPVLLEREVGRRLPRLWNLWVRVGNQELLVSKGKYFTAMPSPAQFTH
jgi:hypothetical protein